MELPENLNDWIQGLSMLGGAAAFCWAVIQFVITQRVQAETRRIEATKPFLERQLKLYTEATQAAATLATATKAEELDTANERFWSLYWGELALVEDKRVEAAMVQIGRELEAGATGGQLNKHSLSLAHACRDSLADSWNVKHWRSPHSVKD